MPSCERNQSSNSPMEQRENQSTVLNGEAQPDQQSKEDTDTGCKSVSMFDIEIADSGRKAFRSNQKGDCRTVIMIRGLRNA